MYNKILSFRAQIIDISSQSMNVESLGRSFHFINIKSKDNMLEKAKTTIMGQETYKEVAGYAPFRMTKNGAIIIGEIVTFDTIDFKKTQLVGFSKREEKFIEAFESIYKDGLASINAMKLLIENYSDVFENPSEVTPEKLLKTKAFSGTYAVATVDWAYDDIGDNYIPIHVHPEGRPIDEFTGWGDANSLKILRTSSSFTPSQEDLLELTTQSKQIVFGSKFGMIINPYAGDLGWVIYEVETDVKGNISTENKLKLHYGDGNTQNNINTVNDIKPVGTREDYEEGVA